jgi:WD40 repeat protein
VYQPDGRELAVFSAYEHALGVKTVAWSPSSQLLAIGSYDQKVRDVEKLYTPHQLFHYNGSPSPILTIVAPRPLLTPFQSIWFGMHIVHVEPPPKPSSPSGVSSRATRFLVYMAPGAVAE